MVIFSSVFCETHYHLSEASKEMDIRPQALRQLGYLISTQAYHAITSLHTSRQPVTLATLPYLRYGNMVEKVG